MNRIINVYVRNKIAVPDPSSYYVCGNKDFVVNFELDDDWVNHPLRTARFSYNGQYQDVVFEGNTCPVPYIIGTKWVDIGLFVGDEIASTPAKVRAKEAIVDGGLPADPEPDVYGQLIDLANETKAIAQSVRDDADRGEFDGEPGHAPVKGTDYWTPQDKQEIVDEVLKDVPPSSGGIVIPLSTQVLTLDEEVALEEQDCIALAEAMNTFFSNPQPTALAISFGYQGMFVSANAVVDFEWGNVVLSGKVSKDGQTVVVYINFDIADIYASTIKLTVETNFNAIIEMSTQLSVGSTVDLDSSDLEKFFVLLEQFPGCGTIMCVVRVDSIPVFVPLSAVMSGSVAYASGVFTADGRMYQVELCVDMLNQVFQGTVKEVESNPPLRIDLAEYGLDVFALFAAGGGGVEFARAQDVFALVEANPISDVNFVITHGDSVYVETKATKVGSGPGNVAGLSAYVPITYRAINSPLTGNYVLGLYIISQGDVPGLVYLTVEKIGENSGDDINIETVVNEVLNALPTWNGGQY